MVYGSLSSLLMVLKCFLLGVGWYDFKRATNSFEGRWAFDDDQGVELLMPLDDDETLFGVSSEHVWREYIILGKKANGTEYEGKPSLSSYFAYHLIVNFCRVR